MRKLFFVLLSIVFCNVNYAQISDDEAMQLYNQAEEKFDDNKFYDAYLLCDSLIVRMKKAKPKVLYLQLKAIYNNIENNKDESVFKLDKSFRTFSEFLHYTNTFFNIVDKNTYPTEKYNEILVIQEYFTKGLKDLEYQKDRKPEDAITFLNECATKFAMKDTKSQYNYGDFKVKFILENSILRIEVFSKIIDGGKPKDNKVARERILIDLSKVWIDYFNYTYQGSFEKLFYSEFGLSGRLASLNKYFPSPVDKNAPMIIGPEIFIDGKSKYDNISWFYQWHYNKNLEYSDEEFEKDNKLYGYSTLSSGFYLYNFFDQNSDEFKANDYRKRIADAFEYLIVYFGGGTPKENKKEIKSKF